MVAGVALFVVLGGSAVAATGLIKADDIAPGAVAAIGEQRVEHIGDRGDPPIEWDLLTGQAVRVAGAVEALVVG